MRHVIFPLGVLCIGGWLCALIFPQRAVELIMSPLGLFTFIVMPLYALAGDIYTTWTEARDGQAALAEIRARYGELEACHRELLALAQAPLRQRNAECAPTVQREMAKHDDPAYYRCRETAR